MDGVAEQLSEDEFWRLHRIAALKVALEDKLKPLEEAEGRANESAELEQAREEFRKEQAA